MCHDRKRVHCHDDRFVVSVFQADLRGPAFGHYVATRRGADVQDLPELFENNRRWAAACVATRPDFFDQAESPAGPAVPVDRVRRQPGARQRDRRPHAGRDVRASQRRQRRGPQRSQLPVGAAVRRRRAAGPPRHRVRALRLRRRPRGGRRRQARVDRQLAAPRAGCARQVPRCRWTMPATSTPA